MLTTKYESEGRGATPTSVACSTNTNLANRRTILQWVRMIASRNPNGWSENVRRGRESRTNGRTVGRSQDWPNE